MCPAATESKSSNPSSKKKLIKKLIQILKTIEKKKVSRIKILFKTRNKSLLKIKKVLKIMMNLMVLMKRPKLLVT